ncbi:hypothetical protein ID875_21420 [Streptomyces globisporus]|uniref:Uncharacterized protein n=1 Tax=Streptomyces globisporus TaxID=1908 RepID=A0A927BNM7_STRGL|nr:hypothetical protein [Streptomyces globisporus]
MQGGSTADPHHLTSSEDSTMAKNKIRGGIGNLNGKVSGRIVSGSDSTEPLNLGGGTQHNEPVFEGNNSGVTITDADGTTRTYGSGK